MGARVKNPGLPGFRALLSKGGNLFKFWEFTGQELDFLGGSPPGKKGVGPFLGPQKRPKGGAFWGIPLARAKLGFFGTGDFWTLWVKKGFSPLGKAGETGLGPRDNGVNVFFLGTKVRRKAFWGFSWGNHSCGLFGGPKRERRKAWGEITGGGIVPNYWGRRFLGGPFKAKIGDFLQRRIPGVTD